MQAIIQRILGSVYKRTKRPLNSRSQSFMCLHAGSGTKTSGRIFVNFVIGEKCKICRLFPNKGETWHTYVRFEVFTAVTMKKGVFWDVTPCGSCKNLSSWHTYLSVSRKSFQKSRKERLNIFYNKKMPSSGMLHRLALVRTGVSEERIATIIRVARIGELGTTLAVTNNRNTLSPS
jgi:hypothetical protein